MSPMSPMSAGPRPQLGRPQIKLRGAARMEARGSDLRAAEQIEPEMTSADVRAAGAVEGPRGRRKKGPAEAAPRRGGRRCQIHWAPAGGGRASMQIFAARSPAGRRCPESARRKWAGARAGRKLAGKLNPLGTASGGRGGQNNLSAGRRRRRRRHGGRPADRWAGRQQWEVSTAAQQQQQTRGRVNIRATSGLALATRLG